MYIKKLRKELQSMHSDDYSVKVMRLFSIYITAVMIKLNVSANEISAANIFVALLAAAMFLFDNTVFNFAGVFLIILNNILDGVDGELSRYYKTSNLTGLFVDRINSAFCYPLVLAAMPVGLAFTENQPMFFLLAIGVAWSMTTLRLIRTFVDASIVDGLMHENGTIHKTETKTDYIAPNNLIRSNKGIIFSLVDLILARFLGFHLFVTVPMFFQTLFFGTRIFESPFLSVQIFAAGLYFFLSVTAIAVGSFKITRMRVPDVNYTEILRKFSVGNR